MRYCETCCGGLTLAGRQALPQSLAYFPPSEMRKKVRMAKARRRLMLR